MSQWVSQSVSPSVSQSVSQAVICMELYGHMYVCTNVWMCCCSALCARIQKWHTITQWTLSGRSTQFGIEYRLDVARPLVMLEAVCFGSLCRWVTSKSGSMEKCRVRGLQKLGLSAGSGLGRMQGLGVWGIIGNPYRVRVLNFLAYCRLSDAGVWQRVAARLHPRHNSIAVDKSQSPNWLADES